MKTILIALLFAWPNGSHHEAIKGVVPKDGTLRITFKVPFDRNPYCAISNVNGMQITPKFVEVYSKPGAVIQGSCVE